MAHPLCDDVLATADSSYPDKYAPDDNFAYFNNETISFAETVTHKVHFYAVIDLVHSAVRDTTCTVVSFTAVSSGRELRNRSLQLRYNRVRMSYLKGIASEAAHLSEEISLANSSKQSLFFGATFQRLWCRLEVDPPRTLSIAPSVDCLFDLSI